MLSTPVLLLLAVGIVLFVLWRRTEDKRYVYGLGVVGVLILLFVGYEKVRKETTEEQILRKLREMAKAVQAKNLDGIFQHVSADFRSSVGDKEALRSRARGVLESGDLTEITIWDEEPAQVKPARDGQKATATIEFRMKPKGPEMPKEIMFRTVAHFVLDPDGEWRLSGFELFRIPGNDPFLPR